MAGPVALPEGPVSVRLDVPPAPVPDAFLEAVIAELGAGAVVCDGPALDNAGSDWWPLAAVWATQGRIPARPAAIVTPADETGMAATIRLAAEHRVPLTPAAGRSGVCGGAVPVAGGAVLDLGGLAGVVDIDERSLLARVRPGTYGPALERALGEHHVTLGHWPQSMDLSTVGGWVACRGAGQYSTRYGKIEDMVAGLSVVDGRGRRLRTGGAPRAATGPDLTQLFVGSEGTLGVVTEVTLRLRPRPTATGWTAWAFARFADGLDACRRVLRRGATPAVLRLYDEAEARRNFSEDGHLLLVLDEADPGLLDWTLATVDQEAHRTPGSAERDRRLVGRWLEHRNDVSALATVVGAGLVVDTIEVAGSWSQLPGLYESVARAIAAVPGTLAATGHCSHAYPDGGCLYFTFAGVPAAGPEDDAAAAKDAYYRDATAAAMEATLAGGGAISHHHGIGLVRGPWLEQALGEGAFGVLRDLKAVLDPAGVLNPGKLGLPSPFVPPGWSWS